MEIALNLALYLVPLGLVWAAYHFARNRVSRRNRAILAEAEEAGLTEPASLHPLIDEVRCIGCAACVTACPEHKHHVLGLIDGRAQLTNPTYCIGHGACKAACPVDAITLVFGTAKRGVDIPVVQPTFETNVPGIFIAGELGGMGLIRNAMEQGKQAMESIGRVPGMGGGGTTDVVIVGCGPAGIAASLSAKAAGLRYVTLDQDSLGGTVYNFPRGKLVMTAPVELPIVGRTRFTDTTKEALLAYFEGIVAKADLRINFRERMDAIVPVDGGFVVKTPRAEYRTRAVLLCIGRRGTPRKLGVPGEEGSPKVVYRLMDPEQYKGQHVLVVGGGDSALEAAASIVDQPGTTVTLSYRSEAFGRAKAANRERVRQATETGRLTVMLKSSVKEITPDRVRIEWDGTTRDLPNDAVIVCAGGILPTPFLKEIGIMVETKYGTA
ncbi:MAG: NAD(P)-binding domain-containing protein [Nitrospirae bacterium]|nr:NAD(P)-binding domain-containing protein [Nitrospirota bacterium]